jgi:hypothetical protein
MFTGAVCLEREMRVLLGHSVVKRRRGKKKTGILERGNKKGEYEHQQRRRERRK